jgi:hypothetical protein
MVIKGDGNVGIGTTEPNAKLHVSGGSVIIGTSETAPQALSVFGNIYTNGYLTWNNGDVELGRASGATDFYIKTYTGSSLTEKMRVTAAGNVGIGTTSPEQQLEIKSITTSGTTSGTLQLSSSWDNSTYTLGSSPLGTINFKSNYGGNGSGVWGQIQVLSDGQFSSSGVLRPTRMTFSTTASGAGGVLTERMRITANGNVGIGTESPDTRLHVRGAGTSEAKLFKVSATSERARMLLMSETDVPTDFWFGNNNLDKWSITSRNSSENYDFGLYNAGTGSYSLRVKGDNNNVGIGTTTPNAKLDVDGGVDVRGNLRLTGSATTTNQSRTIEFTGFDKEGTTDFSDNAYIRHTVNSGGLAGSVLEISSQNDADDGINFLTNGANTFRHNGNVIITGANIGSQSVNFASSAGAVAWGNVSSKPSNIMYYQGFTLNADTMDTNATGFTYAVNAPAVGPVARFSTGGGYDLWLNAPYSGGNNLYFRTRNGDNATLNPWKTIWHDGNLSPVTTTNNTSLNDDSRNTRGVTRVYRRDDNSDFSIQHHWTGSHWHIRGYNGDTFHAEARVGYLNGTWDTNARNYNREWIEMPNHTGLYSPLNNAHFYPNDGTYGAWRIIGSRNGWGGLEFVTSSNGNVSVMVASNATEVGFHNNSVGWQMYWSSGTGYIGKSSTGGGTLARIHDNSNLTFSLSGTTLTITRA